MLRQASKFIQSAILAAAFAMGATSAGAQTASQLISYTNGQLPDFGATSITVANVRGPITSLTVALSTSGTGSFVYGGGISTSSPISSSSYVSATTFYGDGSHLTGVGGNPSWYDVTDVPTGLQAISNTGAFADNDTPFFFVGSGTGNDTGTGNSNVGFGINVMPGVTTGNSNTAIGTAALSGLTSASYNTAIGAGSLASATGSLGSDNVGVGFMSMYNAASAYRSVGLGSLAMALAPQVSNSTCVGYQSCATAGGGGQNKMWNTTALGSQAGGNLADSTGNTLLGYQAGAILTTGNGNIVIGNGVTPSTVPTSDTNYYLNIGNAMFGDISNALASGGGAKIGLNKTSPNAAFDVSGTVSATAFVGGGNGITVRPSGATTSRTLPESVNSIADVRFYGAIPDDGIDDTGAFNLAKATGKDIGVYDGIYDITGLNISASNQSMYFYDAVVRMLASGTTSTSLITLSGDYASLYNAFISVSSTSVNGVETTGFSNDLTNVTVTGSSNNALYVNGLETAVYSGKFRGAANAGILVNKPDLFLLNVYTEQNNFGLYANGVGSITGYHVHAYANTRSGFYLSGASYSQLTSWYADTNGQNGFEIRDTTSGMTMLDCWGFKSNAVAPFGSYQDFAFFNAQNIKIFGSHSSGDDSNKRASFRVGDTSSTVWLYGSHATGDPEGLDNPGARVMGSSGTLSPYNLSENEYAFTSTTVNSGASVSVTVPMLIPTSNISSPGVQAFEIDVLWRYSSGAATASSQKVMAYVANGITPTYPIRIIPDFNSSGGTSINTIVASGTAISFAATPTITVSGPTITSNTTYKNLNFTIKNNDATRNVQAAGRVRYLGTGRGFN